MSETLVLAPVLATGYSHAIDGKSTAIKLRVM